MVFFYSKCFYFFMKFVNRQGFVTCKKGNKTENYYYGFVCVISLFKLRWAKNNIWRDTSSVIAKNVKKAVSFNCTLWENEVCYVSSVCCLYYQIYENHVNTLHQINHMDATLIHDS